MLSLYSLVYIADNDMWQNGLSYWDIKSRSERRGDNFLDDRERLGSTTTVLSLMGRPKPSWSSSRQYSVEFHNLSQCGVHVRGREQVGKSVRAELRDLPFFRLDDGEWSFFRFLSRDLSLLFLRKTSGEGRGEYDEEDRGVSMSNSSPEEG